VTEEVVLSEWSKVSPSRTGPGQVLYHLRLNENDLKICEELGRTSLRLTELREGLGVAVGQHVGTVNLSGVRISIRPKLEFRKLMAMVAYAFELRDFTLSDALADYTTDSHGLADLLGLALLRAVERLTRGGLLPTYLFQDEELSTPRGRIDIRTLATSPPQAKVRCRYEELTIDHLLNRLLRAGLRHASRVVASGDLRLDLARAGDRLFADIGSIQLTNDSFEKAIAGLDRRSRHYHDALTLSALLFANARLERHTERGRVSLSSFLLNMNQVFERFLGRYLSENAPPGVRIETQATRCDVFRYEGREGQLSIRPDFVITNRGKPIAVADAKYKNRTEHPPSSAELYQLTVYGLAYRMPEPREVLLLYPAAISSAPDRERCVSFIADSAPRVRIRLVPVPIDGILDGSVPVWQPYHLA
jgi:5-methylcytosine-specific restriction enzyme subunit McrC